LTLLSR